MEETSKINWRNTVVTVEIIMIKLTEILEEAKKPMVITNIKDIPNIKKLVSNGEVTYRGLGMGKLFDRFLDLSGGEHGTRIKVDKVEYFITDKYFEKLGGIKKIRFGAPFRRG